MVNYFWLIWKDEKKIEKAGLRCIVVLVVAREYIFVRSKNLKLWSYVSFLLARY